MRIICGTNYRFNYFLLGSEKFFKMGFKCSTPQANAINKKMGRPLNNNSVVSILLGAKFFILLIGQIVYACPI